MLESRIIGSDTFTSGKCIIHVSFTPPPPVLELMLLLPPPISTSDLLFFGLLMTDTATHTGYIPEKKNGKKIINWFAPTMQMRILPLRPLIQHNCMAAILDVISHDEIFAQAPKELDLFAFFLPIPVTRKMSQKNDLG